MVPDHLLQPRHAHQCRPALGQRKTAPALGFQHPKGNTGFQQNLHPCVRHPGPRSQRTTRCRTLQQHLRHIQLDQRHQHLAVAKPGQQIKKRLPFPAHHPARQRKPRRPFLKPAFRNDALNGRQPGPLNSLRRCRDIRHYSPGVIC